MPELANRVHSQFSVNIKNIMQQWNFRAIFVNATSGGKMSTEEAEDYRGCYEAP